MQASGDALPNVTHLKMCKKRTVAIVEDEGFGLEAAGIEKLEDGERRMVKVGDVKRFPEGDASNHPTAWAQDARDFRHRHMGHLQVLEDGARQDNIDRRIRKRQQMGVSQSVWRRTVDVDADGSITKSLQSISEALALVTASDVESNLAIERSGQRTEQSAFSCRPRRVFAQICSCVRPIKANEIPWETPERGIIPILVVKYYWLRKAEVRLTVWLTSEHSVTVSASWVVAECSTTVWTRPRNRKRRGADARLSA